MSVCPCWTGNCQACRPELYTPMFQVIASTVVHIIPANIVLGEN